MLSMPRPNRRNEITERVHALLEEWKIRPPDECPISGRRIAEKLGISPTTLTDYGLTDAIAKAREEQHQRHTHRAATASSSQSDQVAELREELETTRERNKSLVSQIITIQHNATRLGVSYTELTRPLDKPDRRTPHTGKGRKRSHK
jgi:predicted RNase H-like nuclease (RuvC/YqgF family)